MDSSSEERDRVGQAIRHAALHPDPLVRDAIEALVCARVADPRAREAIKALRRGNEALRAKVEQALLLRARRRRRLIGEVVAAVVLAAGGATAGYLSKHDVNVVAFTQGVGEGYRAAERHQVDRLVVESVSTAVVGTAWRKSAAR